MKACMNVCVFVLMVVFLNGCGYNNMQSNQEKVYQAWGNVESTMQRRADLIPNLVEVVKGYATHEKDTLVAVQEARSKATSIQLSQKDLDNPKKLAEYQAAQGQLTQALSKLMMVTENYPTLKADTHFKDLMNQLEGTENRINVARQRYNNAVMAYNTSIRTFPNSLTNAVLLHLERMEPFKATENAKTVPTIKF